MSPAAQNRGYPWKYSLFIGMYYTVLAVFQSFVGNFYQDARGIQGTELMWLLVALPVRRFLYPHPAHGRFGDIGRFG